MANHLIHATSPYLLQHAHNPVDWRPWGKEALDISAREGKPIFLSIGYSACHWCHVMAHESFEDPKIARILNKYFVPVKVDREERPDLDSLYMNVVVSMTGQGGWPLSVFLTPQGIPFYGGTYFPPQPSNGMPSFRIVLEALANTWRENRSEIDRMAEHVRSSLVSSVKIAHHVQPIQLDSLKTAVDELLSAYDWKYGGWGTAPKFPQPMSIELLIRQGMDGNQGAQDAVRDVLDRMALGGMYDWISGGFHRYSTDAHWLIPHFEKMLYDNAQLAQVYLHCFLVTGNPAYCEVCVNTLDFILREMRHEKGGFYSSLDADSGGAEGEYYTFTPAEIHRAIPDPEDYNTFSALFAAPPEGNFNGKIILQRKIYHVNPDAGSRTSKVGEDTLVDGYKKHLLEVRLRHDRPTTDDKILTAWNGLALQTFSEAARYLHREDYLAAARENARFILGNLHQPGRLARSWRNGKSTDIGFLEDYASLILGLLSLYQSDPEEGWFIAAKGLAEEMLDKFRDPAGGFFDTSVDQDPLILRSKDMQDNATPSGNAMALYGLMLLDNLDEHPQYRSFAESLLSQMQESVARYPHAYSYWLLGLDFFLHPVQQVAIVGATGDNRMHSLIKTLWDKYRPHIVAAIAEGNQTGGPSLLRDRLPIDGASTAYVCKGFTCELPTIDPSQFTIQLG